MKNTFFFLLMTTLVALPALGATQQLKEFSATTISPEGQTSSVNFQVINGKVFYKKAASKSQGASLVPVKKISAEALTNYRPRFSRAHRGTTLIITKDGHRETYFKSGIEWTLKGFTPTNPPIKAVPLQNVPDKINITINGFPISVDRTSRPDDGANYEDNDRPEQVITR